jgi:AcrR family transcriptional regulator
MSKLCRSQATKEKIQAALWQLLPEKPLGEITVKEVVALCGISRQTFYYHFQDLYGVVEWQFQAMSEEMLDYLKTADAGDRKRVLEMVVEKMRENKTLLLNIYRAFPRSYLERYIIRWSQPFLKQRIMERGKHYTVSEEAVEFLIDLYSFGIASVLLKWLDKGMPGGMVERLDLFYIMLERGLEDALRNLSQ